MELINGDGFKIEKRTFQNDTTYVEYPFIVSGADNGQLELLNNIIIEDVGKILNVYSAYAFGPPSREEDIYKSDVLRINYKIMRNDRDYLSIFYRADFFSPYAAYPTELVYTTNIDIKSGRRIKLSEIIEVNKSLVDDISSWELVSKNDGINDNKEYHQALIDYISGLGREVLLAGLMSADIIGADNYLGIYSYLTPQKIGISISVPNYLGDHVEFEKEIQS
ncbi:MAG: hypothetical protein GX319_04665 [Clostridiales bacterium]|jgi:hypothetical protein|nr:hypothetical protein [Bacillota bacterium]NLK03687.1 hypothetical protein [Clostridiales bacterium]